jgi:hypothetical protein
MRKVVVVVALGLLAAVIVRNADRLPPRTGQRPRAHPALSPEHC